MPDSTAPHRVIKLFYSYSHNDEALRVELVKHLYLLRRQGIISDWHDRMIEAGDEWKREIDVHLEMAQIILLLVSADFLASDYCYEVEMTRAMERHKKGEARVIPIILRPVDWTGAPFAGLEALPKDAKPVTSWRDRDKAFENIAKGIRRVVEALNSNGSINSDDILKSTTLSREGLFFTRIINPQERGAGNIVSTIWLKALGSTQYFVDGIRIQSASPRGIYGASAGVAIPPAAEYRFACANQTDRT
jgi:hypothetical protein